MGAGYDVLVRHGQRHSANCAVSGDPPTWPQAARETPRWREVLRAAIAHAEAKGQSPPRRLASSLASSRVHAARRGCPVTRQHTFTRTAKRRPQPWRTRNTSTPQRRDETRGALARPQIAVARGRAGAAAPHWLGFGRVPSAREPTDDLSVSRETSLRLRSAWRPAGPVQAIAQPDPLSVIRLAPPRVALHPPGSSGPPQPELRRIPLPAQPGCAFVRSGRFGRTASIGSSAQRAGQAVAEMGGVGSVQVWR